MTGINVYESAPFPVDKGYEVYAGDVGERHTDLLTVRLEDISRIGAMAIGNFYGRKVNEIPVVNAGDEQAYAERYKAFKRKATLPAEWVGWQLNSRFAQHFYSLEERQQFAAKWSGSSDLIA